MRTTGFMRGLVALFVLGLTAVAPGMIIHDGSTSSTSNPVANLLAPVDDPGWAYIGQRVTGGGSAVATGVYVGNGYVLTAAHVGAGDIIFNGVTYSAEPGTTVQLQNSAAAQLAGKTADTDLILYRLTQNPAGLSDLMIASAAPSIGQDVVMIGFGRVRNTVFQEHNWSHNATPMLESGYGWSSSRAKAWGDNDVGLIG